MKVPETGMPIAGMKVAAASSSVQLILNAVLSPMTSDTRINFWPPGPTRSMFTATGKKWLNPVIVTVTFVTGLVTAATVMFDG